MPIPTEPISVTVDKIERVRRDADELARQATFLQARIEDITKNLDGLDWTADFVRENDLVGHAVTAADDIKFIGYQLSAVVDVLKQ